MRRASVLTVLVALLLVALAYAVYTTMISVHNTAVVKTVGIDALEHSIDWGTLTPGSVTTRVIHVRSNGTASITTLRFNCSNWNPPVVVKYIAVSWNWTGGVIDTNWVPIKFYLNLSASVVNVTNFSFDTNLYGSG